MLLIEKQKGGKPRLKCCPPSFLVLKQYAGNHERMHQGSRKELTPADNSVGTGIGKQLSFSGKLRVSS